MKKIKDRLIPLFIKEYIDIYRENGLKALFKKGGYRLLFIIFMFYLIRDTILYVIPFLIAYYGFNNLF
tara:strand:- start:233 stop:436 length:204 start_codon:yes stop_codon:yes gene_type:complete